MFPVSGHPFDVVLTPGGRWAFVSLVNAVAVLRTGSPPVLVHTIKLAQVSGLGETLADGGRYLLVAAGTGAVVINVARAERGAADAVLGTLTGRSSNSGAGSATEVAVSPGGRYAFVTLEYVSEAAVFNLGRALSSGFGRADFSGTIPLGLDPVGMAFSPGGRWLYATSEQARPGSLSHANEQVGTLSVISVAKAETDPAASVLTTVPAGCNPVRVITSAGGSVVWVAARASDALLGFSAAALLAGPSRSLRADVPVGEAPVGLALVRGGSRIVVADSNRFSRTSSGNLAVVNVPAALAGRPALLGYAGAGQFPRQLALAPGGGTLYVTNFVSGQLESVNVGTLP
jgi:DNA-binding beta-propeller fold protein YncE